MIVLARRTSIELIIVVVLVMLFVYTPFKIFFSLNEKVTNNGDFFTIIPLFDYLR